VIHKYIKKTLAVSSLYNPEENLKEEVKVVLHNFFFMIPETFLLL